MAERNKRASHFIKDNREALISEWERLAKLKVNAARKAEPLVLRDHLPAILEELHIALDKIGPEIDGRHAGTSGFTRERSVQHGRQRASTQSYTIDQVLHEFIILRHVLTDSLASNDLASRETLEAVDRVVELGLLESAAAFTDSIQQVQQQLLGTLAHDIRTPLSIAHTSLELLDDIDLSQAEAEEVRVMARRGIKRALDMLKELLDSIKVEAGEGLMLHFGENDYQAELREACDEVKLVYGERVRFSVPQTPVPAVFCPSSIRRVIENLISNAVKYGARGSPITVEFAEGNEDVTVSVHNEGEPIPADEQGRIFDFLSTASGSGHTEPDSWGIGLTLVKIVVDAHNGDIRIESSKSRGTTFTVRLAKRPRPPGQIRARVNPGVDR